jgi:hypothetical protein
MKLPAACTKRTGQPRCAQRVEIAMYSFETSCGYLVWPSVIVGLPWRMYAVVLPVSPMPSTAVITTAL